MLLTFALVDPFRQIPLFNCFNWTRVNVSMCPRVNPRVQIVCHVSKPSATCAKTDGGDQIET